MLINVISRLAEDTGFNLVQQRSELLRLAQNGADRIYETLECNKLFREISLVVAKDALVSLPSFVGELKGMRMHTSETPFDLHTIGKPRYVNQTLEYRLKNWRDLGEFAVHTFVDGAQQLTLEIADADANVDILIAGQTSGAEYVEEVVTMDAASKVTVNHFGPTIHKIASVSTRNSDVIIKDAEGTEIARLLNNASQTRYKIVDVSQVYWSSDAADGGTIVDVCYKVPKRLFRKDSDSFYTDSDDYDNAWYHMCMHLYYRPIENRANDSMIELELAKDAMQNAKDSSEGFQQKKLVFARNKFMSWFRRNRYYPGNATNVNQTRN